MTDDDRDPLFTSAGREWMLRDHEKRIDALQNENHALADRVKTIEGKEETRDKRWELTLKAVVTIGGGIIISVVSALIAGGHL